VREKKKLACEKGATKKGLVVEKGGKKKEGEKNRAVEGRKQERSKTPGRGGWGKKWNTHRGGGVGMSSGRRSEILSN